MKRSKFTLMLIVIALCCFAFAGTALAGTTASMNVYADGLPYAYTGCENSYVFELTDIVGLDAGCLEEKGGTIYISFKHADGSWPSQGFDILEGVSLPVKIFVVDNAGNGQWIFTQPTVWTDRFNYAELKIEPMTLEGKITKIIIGDDQQDLWVKNSCCARSYCIEVAMNTNCGDFSVIKNFAIKSSPSSIYTDVSASKQNNLPCNEALSVIGKVYDCGDNYVPNWPLTVAVIDSEGDVIATATGKTDGYGYYDIDFIVEKIGPGDYQVEVTADGACTDPVGKDSFYVDYNAPTHIEIVVTDADGVDGQLRYNKCNKVCIKLLDDCGFPASFKVDPKVYLTATTPGNPPVVAGHFFKECPPLDERGPVQINYVEFGVGETEKCLYMIPLVQGDITLTAAGQAGGNALVETLVVNSIAPKDLSLEITPLVTDEDGNPRAGWPLAAAVRLDVTSSDTYDVTFTANGLPIDFDMELVAAYDYQGADNVAEYRYCTKKVYFYLYPDKDIRGDLDIEVQVSRVGVANQLVGSFVSPVELERTLKVDAWQTFSTPKLIADPGKETPEYGSFKDLLDPIFDELKDGASEEIFVLGYRNGCWVLLDCKDEVNPLEGYFVRTPQREVIGKEPFVLEYVFARATDPSMSMPYWLDLDVEEPVPPTDGIAEVDGNLLADDYHLAPENWNSVGVGVDPKLENTLTRQSDTAAHAYGSLLKGEASYLLWNPGAKLANVNGDFVSNALGGSAFPNTTYDAFTPMYNGDVYWMYGSCWDQDFSTNIGLDIIEWVGSDYNTDFPNQGF